MSVYRYQQTERLAVGVSVELRTEGGRAVLVPVEPARRHAEPDRPSGTPERELDPAELPLDEGLPEALHEWARVAGSIRTNGDSSAMASVGPLVSRRGYQLAARVADSTGQQVRYVDPFTGAVAPVLPRDPGEEPGRPRMPTASTPAGFVVADSEGAPDEPVPWATGLAVSCSCALLVSLLMLTLAAMLSVTSNWLAFGAGVILTAGLAPSIWLLRHVRIWRWTALGCAVGLGVGWLGLPFTLV